jgi:hypothetical protein
MESHDAVSIFSQDLPATLAPLALVPAAPPVRPYSRVHAAFSNLRVARAPTRASKPAVGAWFIRITAPCASMSVPRL